MEIELYIHNMYKCSYNSVASVLLLVDNKDEYENCLVSANQNENLVMCTVLLHNAQ